MKIVYISSSIIPSTTANSIHVMKMCQAFQQLGYQIELVAKANPDKSASFYGKTVRDHYGIQELFKMKLYKPVIKFWPGEYSFYSAVYAFFIKPNIVMTRNIRAAALTSMLGIPTICECHAPPAEGWSIDRLISSRNLLKLIVITNKLKKNILKTYQEKVPESKILVCPDSVDLERFENLPDKQFARQLLGLNTDQIIIGYSGHLYAGRGIELILELARNFSDYLFLIVGGNNDDIKKYEAIAKTVGLKNIIFKGFIPNALLPQYLTACDALLMPHQKRVATAGGSGNIADWTSPMKMFEYMAAKRIIIASDLPVLREILNEKNATLCHPEKLEEWHDAMNKVTKRPEWAENIASTAYKDVLKYTWKNRVQNILNSV